MNGFLLDTNRRERWKPEYYNIKDVMSGDDATPDFHPSIR